MATPNIAAAVHLMVAEAAAAAASHGSPFSVPELSTSAADE
jgi:hypothetical protein